MTTEAIYHHRGGTKTGIPPGLFPDDVSRPEIRGKHFYRNGKLAQIRCISAFLLFLRYCRGEDIIPDLLWYRAFGFNAVRVFGPLPSPPWNLPDYRTLSDFDVVKWDAFLTLLERYALLCNFSVGHLPGVSYKTFEGTMDEIARAHWCLLKERVNEPSVQNKPDPIADFSTLAAWRVPTAYGWYHQFLDADQKTAPPTADFGTMHTPRRGSAWARKFRIAQEAQEITDVPWWNDEHAKVVEPGFHYVDGKNDPATTPREVCWYAGGCYLWMSAYTYHCEEGKWGRTPKPGTLQHTVAEALRDNVFLKIGSEWQTGEYNRGGNGDSPVDNAFTEANQIWTYSSLHAGDKKALSIRFGNIPLKAAHGWQIEESWLNGTMARLTHA